MYQISQFGEGSGPVFLSNLLCTGSEQTLLKCHNQIFVGSYCSHTRDVGLRCERKLVKCLIANNSAIQPHLCNICTFTAFWFSAIFVTLFKKI